MLRRVTKFNTVLRNLTSSTRQLSTQGSDPTGTKKPEDIVDFEDPKHLPLPVYPDRPNEPLETRKQRLLYQSRKRGMLENDLLLSTFAAKYLKSMTAEETALYDNLINGPTNDWDIYNWATGAKPVPEKYNNKIMSMFTEHVKNINNEKRLRQPDL